MATKTRELTLQRKEKIGLMAEPLINLISTEQYYMRELSRTEIGG